MNQLKSIVLAAVLMSLGVVGCGGSEQLIVSAPGGVTDLKPVVGEFPTSDAVVGDSPEAKQPEESVEGAELADSLQAEAEVVQSDGWWQPKASENLKWQWQLQGDIDTTLPVQVYNIDIPQEIIGEQYEDLIDEQWVDYANIDALAPIMSARIERCRSKGFDAIEIDNVDAHNYESRDEQGEVVNIGTNFNMTLDESIAYVRWLTNEAHSRGLGIGLKNAEEMVADVVDEVDWMLVEDCYFDSWCLAATAFIDADKPVFMAEYDDLVPDFAPACELAKSLGYSAIWRDPGLSNRLYLACE